MFAPSSNISICSKVFIVYSHVKVSVLCFRDIFWFLDCEEWDPEAEFNSIFMARAIIRGKFDLYRIKLEENQK